MRPANTTPRAATLLCAAALTLTLAACDPGDPEPTPSTSTSAETTDPSTTATTEPTASYQEEQTASALAFVESFFAEATTVSNNSYEGWEGLQDWFLADPALWNEGVRPGWEALADRGGYSTGVFAVSSATAADWEEDPTGGGFDTVSFELCLDTSSLVDFGEDGTELEQQPQDEPYVAMVTVMGQPTYELGWSFSDFDEVLDRTC